MGQFLGKRQCFTDQAREALPQRVMKALDMIGFPRFLRDRLVPLRRNHTGVGFVLIAMEGGLLTVERWNVGPQFLRAVTTAISHVKSKALTRLGIHGDLEPLLVRLLRHKAPHFIVFRFHAGHHDLCGPRWELRMEVIRTGRKAFHHKVQEPRQTDAHRTAHTTQ
jgi:hypothetical protein